jgi:hypothetical protein
MKIKFTLLSLFSAVVLSVSAQQLNNSGFNSWSALAPTDWATYESVVGQPFGLVVKDTVDKVEGSASVSIKTDSVQAGPNKLLIAGVVSSGTGTYAPPSFNFNGAPFTFRPDTLFFAFKYAPAVGGDTAFLQILLTKNDTTEVIAGGVTIPSSAQWSLIYVPLAPAYLNTETPTELALQFSPSVGQGKAGSLLKVDAVRFGYVNLPSALQQIADELDVNVFPNPASNQVNIKAASDMSGYYFEMVDMNGRIVISENLSRTSTAVNVSELTKGNYIYRISDANGIILNCSQISIAK